MTRIKWNKMRRRNFIRAIILQILVMYFGVDIMSMLDKDELERFVDKVDRRPKDLMSGASMRLLSSCTHDASNSCSTMIAVLEELLESNMITSKDFHTLATQD